jgi:hypothetical protein
MSIKYFMLAFALFLGTSSAFAGSAPDTRATSAQSPAQCLNAQVNGSADQLAKSVAYAIESHTVTAAKDRRAVTEF